MKCTQSHIQSNMLTTKLKALYEFEGVLTLYCLRLGHIDVIMLLVRVCWAPTLGPMHHHGHYFGLKPSNAYTTNSIL